MDSRPIAPDHLLQQLRWRYAVKKFDPTRRIAPETWRALEEALVLTPSSYGLQPWKFLVIDDPGLREQLLAFSWGQRQVVDASHLLVLCIRRNLGLEQVDRHLQRMAELRGTTVEALAKFRGMLVRDIVEGARSLVANQWAANQVYIALGNLMTAAALLGLDTCPMEGFEPAKYDQLLGLPARGLAATLVCPVGYRADDDKYATAAKVRFSVDDVIEHR